MSSSNAPHPFSEQQWQSIQALLKNLDERQSMWLSGYLAGQKGSVAPAAPSAAKAGPQVLIAFGTETGNSEALAQQLAARAAEEGIAAEVIDLANVRARQLTRREHFLVICATHGDGDPPEPIQQFYDAIMADNAPSLKQLKFSVLALGDSTYEHFCVTGIELDERFAALGAQRLAPRVDCDVDFAEPAAQWMDSVLKQLPKASAQVEATAIATAEVPAKSFYSKQQPLSVEVLENVVLSTESRRSPLFHLELALEEEGFVVEPGDAVGVLAHNPPELVARVLNATGLSGDEPIKLKDEAMPLVQALREHCDLTIASKRLVEYWAEISGGEELQELTKDAKAQRAFLQQNQVRDIIGLFPARPEAQGLVDSLRPLQPRLYDVANSTTFMPDELHLLAKQFRYPFRDREELGIASDYLLQIREGESLRIYPHRNARFRLPEDGNVPLILVGEGTGLAPYRAFVQERALGQRQHPIWLTFAEQHFEDDFLYQLDWQQAVREGWLNHLDTVFYGDHPERNLADTLWQEHERFLSWLKDGGHLYLCGEKDMLERCEADLKTRIEAAAPDLWKTLTADKRIHRNLY